MRFPCLSVLGQSAEQSAVVAESTRTQVSFGRSERRSIASKKLEIDTRKDEEGRRPALGPPREPRRPPLRRKHPLICNPWLPLARIPEKSPDRYPYQSVRPSCLERG